LGIPGSSRCVLPYWNQNVNCQDGRELGGLVLNCSPLGPHATRSWEMPVKCLGVV
jgi:hypothetical protein